MMKKQITAALLILAMLLTMTACGSSTAAGSSAEPAAASSAEAADAAEAPAETEAPAEAAEPAEAEAPAEDAAPAETEGSAAAAPAEEAPQAEGTPVETGLFSFVYGDDWTLDTDSDLSDYDDYCYASPSVPDPDSDWDLVYISIEVDLNEPADFAEELIYRDLDPEDVIAGTSGCPTRSIGGVDCWVCDTGDSTYYYGYLPEGNAYISIYVSENDQTDYTDPLLDSITFTAPAYEGTVTPWYWEGTPYSVSELNTQIGSFTVNSRQLPIEQVSPTWNIFDARVAVSGSDYYVLDNGILKKYTRSGDTLSYDSDVEVPYEPSEIAADSDGNLYISAMGRSITKLQPDGTQVGYTVDIDDSSLHPSCTWGVSYFSTDNVVTKFDLTTGEATEYTLEGVKHVVHAIVTENYIVVSCVLESEDYTACLKVFDADFNELMTLGKDETTTGYYGSVSAVTETENGLIVFDGNMRDVYFLDTGLQLITAVDMTDLMGTDYPWPCQAVTAADGSVIVICTDERADRSCDEAVVFQLTGF